MKFGQQLTRNQVPEWASAYINYKSLKKLIKGAQKGAQEGGEVDVAGMSVLMQVHIIPAAWLTSTPSRILLCP